MLQKFLRITALAPLLFVISVVLHNVISAVIGREEPVFFLLAVVGAPLLLVAGLAGASVAYVNQAVDHRHAH
jgi:hypothetical protein